MYYTKIGDQYRLRAPGYVIQASSKEACFDGLMLCMINKVPANSFKPTLVALDDDMNATITIGAEAIKPEQDAKIIHALGMEVHTLSKRLAAQLSCSGESTDPVLPINRCAKLGLAMSGQE